MEYSEEVRAKRRAYSRAWYRRNRPHVMAYNRVYRATHRAQVLQNLQKKYHANAEHYRARQRASYHRRRPQQQAYRQKNKARRLATQRAWTATHREQTRQYVKTRKALKRGASANTLSLAQWQEIKAAYGHRCVYCHRKMQRLTQDHLTPLKHGGAHVASNVVPACASCNSKKRLGPPLVPVQPILLTVAPPRAS